MPRVPRQTRQSFRCQSEGFHPDPDECRTFYRCVSDGQTLTPVRFECGVGTVFDPEINNCNHPWATNRPECGGNQVDGSYGTYKQPTSSYLTTNAPISTPSTDMSQSSIGSYCSREGFLGDPNDCQRFYRCVKNGQGGYTRYEFVCSEGTVWDPDLISCNYPEEVRRSCVNYQGGKFTKNNKIT